MNIWIEKIKKALKNPKFAILLFRNHALAFFSKKYDWIKNTDNKFQIKEYKNYEEYLQHQKSKLEKIKDCLSQYDLEYRSLLRNRLLNQGFVKIGMSVLCLAARIGTEVKSFIDIGCFAVGLDLNPGKDNKYVVKGDFHDIQFASNSVDIIFSNSLDHVLYVEKFIKEIQRVLKPRGLLILEISENGGGYYEAIKWKQIDDIINLFLKQGFKIVKRDIFNDPWKGEHISFKISDN